VWPSPSGRQRSARKQKVCVTLPDRLRLARIAYAARFDRGFSVPPLDRK
jgi:hypothetical protein